MEPQVYLGREKEMSAHAAKVVVARKGCGERNFHVTRQNHHCHCYCLIYWAYCSCLLGSVCCCFATVQSRFSAERLRKGVIYLSVLSVACF